MIIIYFSGYKRDEAWGIWFHDLWKKWRRRLQIYNVKILLAKLVISQKATAKRPLGLEWPFGGGLLTRNLYNPLYKPLADMNLKRPQKHYLKFDFSLMNGLSNDSFDRLVQGLIVR